MEEGNFAPATPAAHPQADGAGAWAFAPQYPTMRIREPAFVQLSSQKVMADAPERIAVDPRGVRRGQSAAWQAALYETASCTSEDEC
jgi:hypothetical protein